MKADERRTPLPVKHQLDHELPTVLHHPEEEMPLLARWLDRAMENRARFWSLIAAVVLVSIGLSVLGSGLTLGRAASDEAWTELENASKPGDRVEIAKKFPKTQAERWALLQAATEYYNQGFNDLPAHREAALPNLKKALDLFHQVATEAEPNSPQARAAALGEARTLEARNELAKAVETYDSIARNKSWAGSDESRAAERYARLLRTPEAEAFYKQLYAYTPPAATIPAGGVGGLDLPLPSGHPPLGGSVPGSGFIPGLRSGDIPMPSRSGSEPIFSDLPPPPPGPEPKAASPGPGSLPDDVFAPAAGKTDSSK